MIPIVPTRDILIPEDLVLVILGLLAYSFADITEFKHLTTSEKAIVKDEATFQRLRTLAVPVGIPLGSWRVA